MFQPLPTPAVLSSLYPLLSRMHKAGQGKVSHREVEVSGAGVATHLNTMLCPYFILRLGPVGTVSCLTGQWVLTSPLRP